MKETLGVDEISVQDYDIPVVHDYVEKLCRALPSLSKGSTLGKFSLPEEDRASDR